MEAVQNLVNPPKKSIAPAVVGIPADGDDGTLMPKLATKFEVSSSDSWRIPMLKTDVCNANNTGILTATIPPGWCLSQKLVEGEHVEDYTMIIDRYRVRMTNEFILKGVKLHKYNMATGGGSGPSVVVGAGRPLLEKGKTKYSFNVFEMEQISNAFTILRELHPYFLFESTSVFQAAVDYVLFVYEMQSHGRDILPQHTAAFMEKHPDLWSCPLNDFPATRKYVSDWLKWERRAARKKYVNIEDEEDAAPLSTLKGATNFRKRQHKFQSSPDAPPSKDAKPEVEEKATTSTASTTSTVPKPEKVPEMVPVLSMHMKDYDDEEELSDGGYKSDA